MKRGLKQTGKSTGFTIVEVMIVLAVTGLLFSVIATTWSGKQHKSEFVTASQDVQSRLQEVISDVQHGYFPSDNNFVCQTNSPGLILTKHASEQGTNQDCVFLGKVVQFAIKDTDPEQSRIYSVAGKRSAYDLSAAAPTVLAPSLSENNDFDGIDDLSETSNLLYGLTVTAMKSGATPVEEIGFLSSLGTQGAGGAGTYKQGIQQVDLYALIGNVTNRRTSLEAAEDINNTLRSGGSVLVNQPVRICFKSGGTDQQALITVGVQKSQLAVDMKIMNKTPVDCGL